MKYKKAPAYMGKTLSIYVGNGDRRVGDHDILEGGDLDRFVQLGMLVRVPETKLAEPVDAHASQADQSDAADAMVTKESEAKEAATKEAEAEAKASKEAEEAAATKAAEAKSAEEAATKLDGVTKSPSDKIAAAAPKSSKRGRKS